MAQLSTDAVESENLEIRLLLEGVYHKYGYDFRHYAQASVKRRVLRRVSLSGFRHISDLLHHLLHDRKVFETFLLDLSISVTEMFRDPAFYRALRRHVVPLFRDRPFIKIWHAGCATGEEAYSMAIVLLEENLYERTMIYATDINPKVIEIARAGAYPLDRIRDYTANYQQAGGMASFADYYHTRGHQAEIHPRLKKNILFTDHNLATDGAFSGDMDLVFCRNVLIYFDRELQNRAIGLFRTSLREGGFMCLGAKESVRFSIHAPVFQEVVPQQRIYRLVRS